MILPLKIEKKIKKKNSRVTKNKIASKAAVANPFCSSPARWSAKHSTQTPSPGASKGSTMMDQNSIYIKKEVIHQLPKQFYQPSYTILKLDRPILSQYKKQLFEREENKNITNADLEIGKQGDTLNISLAFENEVTPQPKGHEGSYEADNVTIQGSSFDKREGERNGSNL